MCKLSPKEKNILSNMRLKEKGLVASQLGIQPETVDVHLTRIRRKREQAKVFLRETEPYKSILYPRRKGE